jgi:hypothetical protein
MARGRGEDAGGALAALRRRIDAWRRTRVTRAMPEPLWAEAVSLSEVHGAYAVARDLGLNYGTLRSRQAKALERGAGDPAPSFLELPVRASALHEEVELVRGDGARMTIRVGHALDVAELASAFLGARRR